MPRRKAAEDQSSAAPAVPLSMRQRIDELLGHSAFEPEQRYWLDTGDKDLNAVLGSRDLGIPYGKLIEIRGEEHGGKTTLALIIAGMAQRDGAAVGYIDLEDSRDDTWSAKMGADPGPILCLYPRLVHDTRAVKGKKKPEEFVRLLSAEELFDEALTGMELFSGAGFTRQLWIVDSIANLQPDMVVSAKLSDMNMRSSQARPQFLSLALPRLNGMAANHNATFLLLNQLRTDPTKSFGNPDYSPGGKALRHNCQVRVNMSRIRSLVSTKTDDIEGMYSRIVNFKNKAGHGSVQGHKVGVKVRWSKSPASIVYTELDDVRA